MNHVVDTQYNNHTGLGNKLFPWARAKVFSQRYGIGMIKQIWFSPRGASVTRGGIDYKKVFGKIYLAQNFRNAKFELGFWHKLVRKNVVYCDDLVDAHTKYKIENKPSTFVFKWNTEHHFSDLIEHRSFIMESLLDITRKNVRIAIKSGFNDDYIAVNYRSGNDFVASDSVENGYKKTSLDWFEEQMILLQKSNKKTKFLIVSDGSKKHLAQLLKLPNTVYLNQKSAIADLWILSNAKTLLVSGNSTFSAWASFLGGMPTYAQVGSDFKKFNLPNAIFT